MTVADLKVGQKGKMIYMAKIEKYRIKDIVRLPMGTVLVDIRIGNMWSSWNMLQDSVQFLAMVCEEINR